MKLIKASKDMWVQEFYRKKKTFKQGMQTISKVYMTLLEATSQY